jgi:hypothetical protein
MWGHTLNAEFRFTRIVSHLKILEHLREGHRARAERFDSFFLGQSLIDVNAPSHI